MGEKLAIKPTTQSEVINQMWYSIHGTNGADGMVNQLKEIKKNMVTKAECRATQAGSARRRGGKAVLARRGVDAAVIGLIVSIVSNWDQIVVFLGRLFSTSGG
jgi:hypothetical protein